MKKLEKRVERELVDILYSIDKSMSDNLYIRYSKLSIVFYRNPFFHNILILDEGLDPAVLNITLMICEHDNYMVKSLNFRAGQRLLEKRNLVEYLRGR